MKNCPLLPADILLPDDKSAGVSFDKWSVIACDQFSSQPDYWAGAADFIGDAPSTLELIIPEAYLGQTDEDTQSEKICINMQNYLNGDVLQELKDSYIYIERTMENGKIRKGLIGIVRLDDYDFASDSAMIRASEATILDRLPARISIRKRADIELPHIIAFINDKQDTVFKTVCENTGAYETVYDFDLMQGGGHIRGQRITGDYAQKVADALVALYLSSTSVSAPGAVTCTPTGAVTCTPTGAVTCTPPGAVTCTPTGATAGRVQSLANTAIDRDQQKKTPFMIIGDGNHSLAAAKVYWDELKKTLDADELKSHPAQFALLEVCNVYDPAIDFEAIHRVIFDIDAADFLQELKNTLPGGNDYTIGWVDKDGSGDIGIKSACIGDMLELVQNFIDDYLSRHPGSTVDYVHGADSVRELAQSGKRVGLILPAMDKSEFFDTVAIRGIFPRKSFSVGHATEKRYYLECRRIS